eukprot:CAMPEP_0198237894 /NCGR_PEP_ID=MMETSP1446-20131203/3659_1 /TAXON_ID=1461542 ORGANISM="Unidentified sp, Strain CCMP2111" /NCGR_SAMPLE_ID=MMETSP1446 /ASSEMBLY_ACC=CAM_ASM_001112 /LENGTH=231 /DNA_ID=CAMNT_0043920173 /DNA_START=287 /DNA_END=982 /DNA_ORIENTATION=-
MVPRQSKADEAFENRAVIDLLKRNLQDVWKIFVEDFEKDGAGEGEDADPEDARNKHRRFTKALDLFELSFLKLQKTCNALRSDKAYYEDLLNKYKDEGVAVKKQIENKKVELVDALQIKEFNRECEDTKETLMSFPASGATSQEIQQVKMEIARLEKELEDCEEAKQESAPLVANCVKSLEDLERFWTSRRPDAVSSMPRADANLHAFISQTIAAHLGDAVRDQEMDEAMA